MNKEPKYKVNFDEATHTYKDESGLVYPSVSQILKAVGVINTQFSNENSMNFGSVLHKTLQLLDENNLGEYDMKLRLWVKQYQKFLKEVKPIYDLIEQPLISKLWGFAGTLDRLAGNVLVDLKTGNHYPHHELQLSLYAVLVEENYGIKIKEQYALYIWEECYKYLPLPNKRTVALGCVSLYKWLKEKGKNGNQSN